MKRGDEVINKEIMIPVWEKINLTIDEAAEYSNIGKNRIRELIKEKDCDFILQVGTKTLIKRVKFENYLALRSIV